MQAGVVLVAAGAGRRLGRPKALVPLQGTPMVVRAAAAFAGLAHRVVVLRAEDRDACDLPGWVRVAGGARRRDSVAAGLDALGPEVDTVLVHDAARPLVPPAVVERVLAAAATHAAVVPVLPVADTLKQVAGGRVTATVDRAGLALVQTPQAFRVALLRRALLASDADATDEAALVEALGESVITVEGHPLAFKVTTPADLALAGALAAAFR